MAGNAQLLALSLVTLYFPATGCEITAWWQERQACASTLARQSSAQTATASALCASLTRTVHPTSPPLAEPLASLLEFGRKYSSCGAGADAAPALMPLYASIPLISRQAVAWHQHKCRTCRCLLDYKPRQFGAESAKALVNFAELVARDAQQAAALARCLAPSPPRSPPRTPRLTPPRTPPSAPQPSMVPSLFHETRRLWVTAAALQVVESISLAGYASWASGEEH